MLYIKKRAYQYNHASYCNITLKKLMISVYSTGCYLQLGACRLVILQHNGTKPANFTAIITLLNTVTVPGCSLLKKTE